MSSNIVNLLIILAIVIFGIPLSGIALYLKTKKKYFAYIAMGLDFFVFIIILTWLFITRM